MSCAQELPRWSRWLLLFSRRSVHKEGFCGERETVIRTDFSKEQLASVRCPSTSRDDGFGCGANQWLGRSVTTFQPGNGQTGAVAEQAAHLALLVSLSQVESAVCWSRGPGGACADGQGRAAAPGAVAHAEPRAAEQPGEGAFSSRTTCSGGGEASDVEGCTVRQRAFSVLFTRQCRRGAPAACLGFCGIKTRD